MEEEMDLAGQPLLQLIKNLVEVSNADGVTNIENSQILSILRLEFNMDEYLTSDLIKDIYINVLKKYLRIWPRWDGFDKLLKNCNGFSTAREELILAEYAQLKDYLQNILNFTINKTKRILHHIQKAKSKNDEVNVEHVVLEISCSRNQLNNLIFKTPHPLNGSIFNISTDADFKKPFRNILFKELLHWPNIAVYIALPDFSFYRNNYSHVERSIVNKKIQTTDMVNMLPKDLYSNVEMYLTKRNRPICKKFVVASYLVQLINYVNQLTNLSIEHKNQLICLFNEIKTDLFNMSEKMFLNVNYQFFLNKYPYHRNLYSEHDYVKQGSFTNIDKYDLRLRERIAPSLEISLQRFAVMYTESMSGRIFNFNYQCFSDVKSNWLRFECSLCNYGCSGFLGTYHIMAHVNNVHGIEPDWQCSKCETTFTMLELCRNRWSHECRSE